MAKGFGVVPITNTIFYGTVDKSKNCFTGKREDVTDEAIGAVFQWFMGNVKEGEEYCITYDDSDYELVMRKRKNKYPEE